MWVHWPKCLKILFLSKRYLISFLISYRLFVVFNNANAVSAEMWVWGFGNHAWNKSLLSSHSSATRDLTRLLYHLWFPKPHTHISYSQHLHIDVRNITWNRSENKNFVNQLWSVSLSLPRNEKRGFRKTSNNWEMGANCCVEYFSECFTCNQKLSSQNCGVLIQFQRDNFLFLPKRKQIHR